MDYDYQGRLEKRKCACGEWFQPTTKRNKNCIKCQFSDARRKRYSQTHKKLKRIIVLK